jgi:hypothetical protein
MFIGSSAEGLPVAQALQAELDHDVETTIWSQGVFGLSGGTLETLMATIGQFDFAALVLTPDDLVTKRGETRKAPRDNVMFEAGLFIGGLGRSRTFFVVNREEHVDLPSDLAGITMAQYRPRTDGNLQAAVGPVATNIRAAIAAADIAASRTARSMGGKGHALPGAAPVAEAEIAPDLEHLLATAEQIDTVVASMSDTSNLRGDVGRLYGALMRNVQAARPRDTMANALTVPKETAMSGIFQTTVAEARLGLSILRSALLSSP